MCHRPQIIREVFTIVTYNILGGASRSLKKCTFKVLFYGFRTYYTY